MYAHFKLKKIQMINDTIYFVDTVKGMVYFCNI